MSAAAYEATVDKSGSFALAAKDAPKLTASLLQCWRVVQRFPEVKMMDATLKQDSATVELSFKYLWNKGGVKERLVFDCRSVEASYSFAPDAARDLGYVIGLVTLDCQALEATLAEDKQVHLDAKSQFLRQRYQALAVRGQGAHELDITTSQASFFGVESFPRLMLRNPAVFARKYQPGEEMKLSFRIYLSLPGGKTLPDSPLTVKK